MQILESSALGLRSARIVLSRQDHPLQVTLFPMVHMGEAAFFETVYRDDFSRDIVLVEGVNSPIARRISRVCRWSGSGKRLGLSMQPRYLTSDEGNPTVALADLSPAKFDLAWRTIPFWARVLFGLLAACFALRLRWSGTRQELAGLLADDNQCRLQVAVLWQVTS